jgi:beclin 1
VLLASLPDRAPHAQLTSRLPPAVQAAYSASRSPSYPSLSRRFVPPASRFPPLASANRGSSPAESFVVLSESALRGSRDPSAPSSTVAKDGSGASGRHASEAEPSKSALTLRLFDLVSAQSDVDHPVCVECADSLLELMQSRMDQLKSERDVYLAFQREMAAKAKADPKTSKDDLRREIAEVGFIPFLLL